MPRVGIRWVFFCWDERCGMPGSPRRPFQFGGLLVTGGDWKSGGVVSEATLNEIEVNLGVAVAGVGQQGRDEFLRRTISLPGHGELRVVENTPSGNQGFTAKVDFGGPDSTFFVKILLYYDKLVFQKTTQGMTKYVEMNECGVVKFRSWGKFSDSEKRGVVVIVMQVLKKDLQVLFDRGPDERVPGEPVFDDRMRKKLGEFLLKLLDCLTRHETSFTDLKPKNIGFAEGEFRLIDIDSIGRDLLYTAPWHIFGRDTRLAVKVNSGFDFVRDTGITKAEYKLNSTIYSALAIGATACRSHWPDPEKPNLVSSILESDESVESRSMKLMAILEKDAVVEMRKLSQVYGRALLEFIPRLRTLAEGSF